MILYFLAVVSAQLFSILEASHLVTSYIRVVKCASK
jgi:hypothetical protein